MCVIAYIPKESKGIEYTDFKNMWETNPDGAGIMWIDDDGDVFFKKGYFDMFELYKDYCIIKYDYNFECALHFRIRTSGNVDGKMCHPFIMTNKDKIITKTHGRVDTLVMHNGIINIKPHRKDFSDTAEYIERNLYPMYKKDKRFFLHYTKRRKAEIENEIGFGSKLLIFCKDGVEMVGRWQKFKDYYCSNTYFDKSWNYYNYKENEKKNYWDFWDDDKKQFVGCYYD